MMCFFLCGIGIGDVFADLPALQEAAQYSDPLVANGKGNMSYVWARVDSTSARSQALAQKALDSTPKGAVLVRLNQGDGTLFFAFNGPKMRCNEKTMGVIPGERAFKRHWQSAYNGEKTDLLRLDGIGKGGLIKPFASTYEKNTIQVDRYDPRYNAMTIFGVPVGTFLKGVTREGAIADLVQMGDESEDGVPCHVVTGTVNGTDIRYTVWIAPGQTYRPKRIEVRTGGGLKVVRNQFVQHTGDVWFPKQTTVEDYYLDPATGKQVLSERFVLTVGNDYAVNTEVPDTLFSIPFPKGLSVYDFRTSMSYKAE